MKLVDEKKTLTEVSNLRRLLKSFDGIEGLQKTIDTKRAENADLKKTFDSSENKALSEKYLANQKELDEIKAGRDDVNKNFDKLKAERERLHEKQNETWKAIQDIKDKYYSQRKEYKAFEDQIYQQRREKQRTEREQYEKDRRKKAAEVRLEEASAPAYAYEIVTAENIIRHFDSSYGAAEADKGPSKFAAPAQRSIDESGFKGMSVMKKEEEDFFTGGGGKKKGKKGAKPAGDNKFNLSLDIIEGLGRLGVDPPSNQSEVTPTVEKLKAKVADWKKDQKEQTDKVSFSFPVHDVCILITCRTLKRLRRRSRSLSKKLNLPLLLHHPSLEVSDRTEARRSTRKMLVLTILLEKSMSMPMKFKRLRRTG